MDKISPKLRAPSASRPDDDLRVKPSTVFTITVDKEEVRHRFEAPEAVELLFVLADVDDAAGLDAAALGVVPGGTGASRTPYWSPDSNSTSTYPVLRHLVPEGLHEAHKYPSIFRGWKLKEGEKLDFIVQNRLGILPYDVKLTFFARQDEEQRC